MGLLTRKKSKVFTALNAVTGVTTGQRSTGGLNGESLHTYQINTTGGPSAVTVAVEGSLDGNSWFELAAHTMTASELSAEAAMFHIKDRPVPYTRTNLTTLSGGTAPTVTVQYRIM